MKINANITIEDKQSRAVLAALQALKETFMAKVDDILAKIDKINAATTDLGTSQAQQADSLANVAADIQRIKEQVTGGLTASEADGVVTMLSAAADTVQGAADAAKASAASLKALADENPDPAAPTA